MLSRSRTKRVVKKFKELSKLVVREDMLCDILNDDTTPENVYANTLAELWNTRALADELMDYLDAAGEHEEIQATVTRELAEDHPILVTRIGNLLAMYCDGKVGMAKCHADDQFDYQIGFRIAYNRLGEQFDWEKHE